MEQNLFLKQQLDRIERYSLMAAKTMLTLDEATAVTGMSRSCIYKLTSQRKIPCYKPNGKLVYFDKSELETWLKRNPIVPEEKVLAEGAGENTTNLITK